MERQLRSLYGLSSSLHGIMKCTKATYRTKQDADDEMRRIAKTSDRKTIPARSYLCPHCHLWHLTSQPLKQELKNNEIVKSLQKENCELKKQIADLNNAEKKEQRKSLKANEQLNSLKSQLEKAKQANLKLRNMNYSLIAKNIKQQDIIERLEKQLKNQ